MPLPFCGEEDNRPATCQWDIPFPYDGFAAMFPQFVDQSSKAYFDQAAIEIAGKMAMSHIGKGVPGMPMENPRTRLYALYLVTAHILLLHKKALDDIGDGNMPSGGLPYKATVGSVSVENVKPNSFTGTDYSFWLQQTTYGQEYLSLLDSAAPLGVFLNTRRDSVRVLY